MNDVIKSGNIIKKIRDGKQLEEIALFARNCIFRDGPKDTLVLEILSYLKLFQPTFFEKFEDELIETMGLFFKNPSPDTLQGVVFDMYRQHIKEKYGEDYTPMQASILEQIEDKHHFSFSAPTSTGKSFVFRNLIRSASNDVVVIVPSRALINEYYEATSDERALRLAKYFKYGTDKEREIWMLRYGFSFEEIEWVSECVDSIDETEIKFNDKINALDDAQLKSIEQYVHE